MEKLEKYWNRVIFFLIISSLFMILIHLSSQVFYLKGNSDVDTNHKLEKQNINREIDQDSIWKNTEFINN